MSLSVGFGKEEGAVNETNADYPCLGGMNRDERPELRKKNGMMRGGVWAVVWNNTNGEKKNAGKY